MSKQDKKEKQPRTPNKEDKVNPKDLEKVSGGRLGGPIPGWIDGRPRKPRPG
ncbi:hypothetical protein [Legionella jordanis]|uniref:Uncharacterized protein n=1 Tax=Legionella jordanis TaxID=456 RepID=A0A0W0V8G6_9GAMM|nr:hypothetical protein [Legionella jordanis]KTD16384.1 hypothetical protein Ljor_0690 [Legionella jordanis]VEH12155.1 Uncharacterised protein [Legionella jordanis]